MKRPLVYAFAFLIAGILTGYYYSAVIFLCAALAFGAVCARCRLPVLAVFYFMGIIAVIGRTQINPAYSEFVGETITVRGVVTDETRTSGGYRLIVKTGGIKIAVSTANEAPVGTGGAVELTGRLEALSTRQNPGGFDERMYLRARGVHYKMFIRHVTPEGGGGLRGRIAAVYDDVLPAKESGIIKAMILGDKTGLSDDIKNIYRVAGIYHILAISGLHISVLALFVDTLLSLVLSRRMSGLATLAFLAGYSVFTGLSVSVVRAAIMSGVFISANIIYREKDLLSATAFAGILLLLYQPLYLWDAGFLYSFAAVIGIATLSPLKYLLRRLRLPRPVLDTLAATLAATLCTTPIAAYYFYYVMPYGVFVNLLIVPTAAAVVVLGFMTGIIGLVFQPAAAIPAGSLYTIFKVYEWICNIFAGLPGAAILTGSWNPVLIVGWYVLLAVAMFKSAQLFYTGLAAYAALVFVCALPKPIEIYRLNVDSGWCAVLTNAGTVIVFDGGGDNAYELTNYLSYRGIGVVDAYFGLHDSQSHAGSMLNSLSTRAIFLSQALAGLEYYADGDTTLAGISPGQVFEKSGLEVRITEDCGVMVTTGGETFKIR